MSHSPDSSQQQLAEPLRRELKALLTGGHAHATLDDAVKDFPVDLRGNVPEGLPYSAWQILEHLRLAQRDMLDFSRNEDDTYKPMRWPEDYWPEQTAPPDENAWDACVRAIHEDRKAFEKLLDSAETAALTQPFAWGDGQTLLREVLQVADHNAYHIGELIIVRRLLGAWKK